VSAVKLTNRCVAVGVSYATKYKRRLTFLVNSVFSAARSECHCARLPTPRRVALQGRVEMVFGATDDTEARKLMAAKVHFGQVRRRRQATGDVLA